MSSLPAMADWSELTNDVLKLITSKLELPDYYRFGAVCKNWHSAAKAKHYLPAKHLPWLILGEDEQTKKRAFFSFSESKHYYMDIPELYGHVCRGSSFGWLFTVDREFDGHLLNPLTRECFKLPPFPDFGNYHPIEKFRALHGKIREFTRHIIVVKAILSNNPSENRDFTVVILIPYIDTVAFWRPGDHNWSTVEHLNGNYDRIMEIKYFKGNLYGLTSSYNIIALDLGPHPKMTMVCPAPIISRGSKFDETYLVDFAGESLILIHRIEADGDYEPTDLDDHEERRINIGECSNEPCVNLYSVTKNLLVFELELEGRQFHERHHIDGSAFFLGCGSSLVIVDPSQVPGCVPDRISYSGSVHSFTGFDDTGFYDMVSETIGEYAPSRHLIPFVVPPVWFTPYPWSPKGGDELTGGFLAS